jgi:AmiR/NasT family two-component response regulator
LIVGHDPIVRMDLRALVTSLGHRVVGEAETGSQALSLARGLRPDITVLDAVLPALSGLDVARVIGAERLSAILLFAGAAEAAAVLESDSVAVMAFLSRPFREADLRVAIPVAVARFQERITLEDEVKSLNERIEARKLVGRAKAILMEKHGLSEREAFRRIQAQSAALNKPVHEIARAIITASEISSETLAAPVRLTVQQGGG